MVTVDGPQWLRMYAAELGVEPPSDTDVRTLLDLAAEAAHASERTSAPITCWLAARAGLSPEEGLAVARRLAEPAP